MAGTGRVRWARVVAEGVAIVISILLAFAIDAWWNGQEAASQQEALLETFVVEVRAAIESLEESVAVHDGTSERYRAWDSVTVSTSMDSVAALVRPLYFYNTPSVDLSAVDAALANGLTGISDGDLRAWFAAWPGLTEDFAEEVGALVNFYLFVAPAYFVENDIPFIAAFDVSVRYSDEDLRPLVGDAGFHSLYMQADQVTTAFVDQAKMLLGHLEQGESLALAALER